MEAVQVAGNIAQGVGGFAAGKATAKVDKQNAQVALEDAVGSEQQVDTAARTAMGEQISQQGAGGFQVGTGSNLDALAQSATNREMDLMTIRRQAQSKADGFTYQAGLDKLKAKAALAGGLFGAAGALSKGFSDAAQQRQLAYGTNGTSGSAIPDDWDTSTGGTNVSIYGAT